MNSGVASKKKPDTTLIISVSADAIPEFTWSYDPSRRCWVIRQRGAVYSVIPTGRRYPAHTFSYVERTVSWLKKEAL